MAVESFAKRAGCRLELLQHLMPELEERTQSFVRYDASQFQLRTPVAGLMDAL